MSTMRYNLISNLVMKFFSVMNRYLSRGKNHPKRSVRSWSSSQEMNGILKNVFAPSVTVIWHAGLELKPPSITINI